MRYNDKVLSSLFEFIRRLVSSLWEVVDVSHFVVLFRLSRFFPPKKKIYGMERRDILKVFTLFTSLSICRKYFSSFFGLVQSQIQHCNFKSIKGIFSLCGIPSCPFLLLESFTSIGSRLI